MITQILQALWCSSLVLVLVPMAFFTWPQGPDRKARGRKAIPDAITAVALFLIATGLAALSVRLWINL